MNKRQLLWLRNNLLCVMIVMVLVLFLANLCLVFLPFDENGRGTFGDQFGVVNALFSGLAFAGLIYTIILQRHDLKLQRRDLHYQRRELELTRKEMEEQTAEFEKQNETLKIQRFENLFYNMLNLQQQIVDGLRYDYFDDERATVPVKGGITTDKKLVKREVVGREVFRYLFSDVLLVENYINLYGYRQYLKFCGLEKYDRTLIPTYFDHYFRHLIISAKRYHRSA